MDEDKVTVSRMEDDVITWKDWDEETRGADRIELFSTNDEEITPRRMRSSRTGVGTGTEVSITKQKVV